MTASPTQHVRWFRELSNSDVALVGGKNASLGELYQQLAPAGVPVPNGFAIIAQAQRYVLDKAGVWEGLHEILDDIDVDNLQALEQRSRRARELVYGAPLPEELIREIRAGAAALRAEYGDDMSFAVRSSATAEDLPTASFAGQHESFLNIRDDEQLLDAYRRCLASLYTARAIHYRVDQGFDHFKVLLSVGVMKMVRSDLASSGVIFTVDTESGFRDVVFVTGAYGLGENVVQGAVDPDEFYVHKPTFAKGARTVLRRRLGSKKIKMIYADGRTRDSTRNVPTSNTERDRFCLTDQEVLVLASHAIKIEEHYSRRAGHSVPMDIEWAKDGDTGLLYIVQARPETVTTQVNDTTLVQHSIDPGGDVVVTGHAIGNKVSDGHVRVISGLDQLNELRPGEILVADITTPDWEPVMKIAAAVVTNRGGRTCHAAIVSRELGLPAIVGCGDATERLSDGETITVSCAEGEIGRVYAGLVPHTVTETDLSDLARPKTQIMINLGNPELAFQMSRLPNDGVGLARMEFIIGQYVEAHPMALLHPERVSDATERAAIERLTRHHLSPEAFFIERLSEGVGTIAAAFYPKPVIVRMSDFKTNEYAALLGGQAFEPDEANPMLGFRGASRYTHPAYKEGFALECAAMKRVREDMGLSNVKLMIPFCRRVDEARRVIEAMAEHGLQRGRDGLEIYLMCEIPNNIFQIDAFAEHVDGFSIGSNDLTQLVLGVDRDSAEVAFEFDERDPGVKIAIGQAIEGARRNGCHSGICGQAPSDYPEMAAWLVEVGIGSMSLNPDVILATTAQVLELEERLGRSPRGD